MLFKIMLSAVLAIATAGGKSMNVHDCLVQNKPHCADTRNESMNSINRSPEVNIASWTPKSNEKQTPRQYRVKKGDTLYRIALKHDVSVDVIMLENHIVDPTALQIGTVLTIPPSDAEITAWLNLSEGKVEKVMTATLTAYTAGFESTGKTPSHPAYGITSSGSKVKEGRTIAVDPKVIPIDSTVYIEDVGLRRAEDTGSAIKGARIDVFIEDLEEALEFGVKKDKKVYVLSTPPISQSAAASR